VAVDIAAVEVSVAVMAREMTVLGAEAEATAGLPAQATLLSVPLLYVLFPRPPSVSSPPVLSADMNLKLNPLSSACHYSWRTPDDRTPSTNCRSADRTFTINCHLHADPDLHSQERCCSRSRSRDSRRDPNLPRCQRPRSCSRGSNPNRCSVIVQPPIVVSLQQPPVIVQPIVPTHYTRSRSRSCSHSLLKKKLIITTLRPWKYLSNY
jgi:hypothetical protein